jgi:hypothetical protein
VELSGKNDKEEINIRGELGQDDSITRLYNGVHVDSWPWETPELKIYSPFILQHALQDLLLTTPSDRYSRFSKLLGTQILDDFQDIFNSLATQYNPPVEVRNFLTGIEELLSKIKSDDFSNFIKAVRGKNLPKAIEYLNVLVSDILVEDEIEVINEEGKIIPEILEKLIENRKEEVSAVFDKDIAIQGFLDQEQLDIDAIQERIASFISRKLIDQYLEYAKLRAHAEFKKQSDFFEFGLQVIEKASDQCPFCGTEITDEITAHIIQKHASIHKKINNFKELDRKKTIFLHDIETFKKSIDDYFLLLSGKAASLLEINNDKDIEKMNVIFGKEYQADYENLLVMHIPVKPASDSGNNRPPYRNNMTGQHIVHQVDDMVC